MPIAIGALLGSFIVPLLYYFFLKRLRGDEAYKTACRKLFFGGMRAAVPVILFSLILTIVFSVLDLGRLHPLAGNFFRAFITAALLEELFKYRAAKKGMDEFRSTLSFLDVMVFCVCSATGFELLESVEYLFVSTPGQMLVRGATDMHAVFALIVGYFTAKGIKKGSEHPEVKGLLLAILIHGTYDFYLDEALDDSPLTLMPVHIALFCFVLFIYSIFFFRKAVKDPYYTEPLFPEETPSPQEPAGAEEDASADPERSQDE